MSSNIDKNEHLYHEYELYERWHLRNNEVILLSDLSGPVISAQSNGASKSSSESHVLAAAD